MKHKIEVIDYLRGLSIVLIILLHIILPTLNSPQTAYSTNTVLFNLRDILNFSIVTIVMCSGFSLYLSANNLSFKFRDILSFYLRRLKRLIIPWWIALTIGLILYSIMDLFFGLGLEDLTFQYIISSYLLIGGVPIRWLILLMVFLSFLFPFLTYIYQKNSKIFIPLILILYLFFTIISAYNPLNFYQQQISNLNFISVFSFLLAFVLGWSLIYLLGFYLENLYNKHKLMKEELMISFNFIFLFIIIYAIYKIIGLETAIYANKYPPSPYYLTFSIAITFLLLNLFFAYKHLIHTYLKRIFSFFSSNSYWLFLWSVLALITVQYFFSFLTFINIYIRLVLEFIANLVLVTILVILQKKLIKIEMHLEKHHF